VPRRRYRRRAGPGQLINDTADLGARLPWQATLLLGAVTFVIFYLLVPLWLDSLRPPESNPFSKMTAPLFDRRERIFRIVAIACALASAYFALRAYVCPVRAREEERSLVAFASKVLARWID